MSPLPNDWSFWQRLTIVLSVIWIAAIAIVSVTTRDFRWFPYAFKNDYSFGPAPITAFLGVVAIVVGCMGIPWILNRRP